jgi:DNA polymerase delta subunit 2
MPGPDTVIVSKIVGLTHKADTSGVVVIGTVYKEQRLKPNILEEYAQDRDVKAPVALKSYISRDDSLILEDESGRVALLCGPGFPLNVFVTGVVLAVRGQVEESGEFRVEDWCVGAGIPFASPPFFTPLFDVGVH